MNLPKTRKEALVLGVSRYFTGKPCKHGHVAPRNTPGGNCSVCGLERVKRAYAINPEPKRAARKIRYYENPEKARETSRAWYAENREYALARHKAWRDKNPDIVRKVYKAWSSKNPEKLRTNESLRRGRKLSATPVWLTDQQKLEIEHKYLLAKIHESVTGIKWHVDHIIPLKHSKVCGLHVPWNLQVIPASENQKKYNLFEVEQ